ncbi:hypothetical protein CK489_06150 [Bradyrhizobium sp. UFLA03-84]|uniref:HD domain-containing protein n=1 Tax=Bradyrhizobium sp. UFLA03-84 TaxID=418599 RepID=UPI000BAE345B|nr:hypothetical protein [Bradyrhizobium sp. UFLA03-84]PAY10120.1 hypothetical protein CK489_06150 [Bradyrhizobium sp. UFLA03-84]
MSDISLNSYPEVRAQAATAFEGFGVSLAEIKRTTAELLSQIGKHGFFAEYSKHDISHIDEVLKLADWLVDEETKKMMSDADWFLITLSIYFHDMGMLVTREEFIQYCAIILRAADLLHMRRDRTPSVLFRVINPTDPISQRE